MSKWITWQEILKKWRISPLDFYSDYIQKGLSPHTQSGCKLDPRDIMGNVYSKTEYFEDATPVAYTVEGENEGEGIENSIYYISKRQTAESNNNNALDRLNETTWADFELPISQREADFFFKEMKNTLYDRENADNLKKNKPINEYNIKPENKLRPNQRHKKASRIAAKKIWDATPPGKDYLTIGEMSEHFEIREACKGTKYSFTTYQRWFTDLNPNPNPGRRKQR